MAYPGPAISTPALHGLGLLALLALTGCSDAAQPQADRLELATIPHWKEVPKSSPSQFVRTFERFCANRSAGMAAMDATLRKAGYVPKVAASARRPAIYVVDDRRPAVVVGERICGVRAVSRTGQTERMNRYVAAAFPEARPVGTQGFSTDVEQVWQIEGGMIATTRNDWVGNRSAYTVALFRPGA